MLFAFCLLRHSVTLTVGDEPEGAREPDLCDVVPVGVEDEGEVAVERDARPRRDLAAVPPAEGRLDERGDVLSLDLREQVQVLVVASEGKSLSFSLSSQVRSAG